MHAYAVCITIQTGQFYDWQTARVSVSLEIYAIELLRRQVLELRQQGPQLIYHDLPSFWRHVRMLRHPARHGLASIQNKSAKRAPCEPRQS